MRIAFFVNRFPALSQTFILNQICCLVDAGHTVDIFARRIGNEEANNPFSAQKNLSCRIVYYGGYLERAEKSKVLRYCLTLASLLLALSKNPLKTLQFLYLCRLGLNLDSYKTFNDVLFFLRSGPISQEIVQCHFGTQGNLAALLKSIGLLDGTILTTFHGYDMSKYVKINGPRVYDLLFRRGDLFLPISDRWKNELISMGCDGSKIIVHRMGVDLERLHDLSDRADNASCQVMSVGRLVEKKGFEYAIKAFAEATKGLPNATYQIVGDGPLKNSLADLILSLGAQDKIKLLGWREQEEVFSLLGSADIFLAPSVTDAKGDQEGIPVVLMEAMAHGLPVLSTWHSGISELVQDGTSGFLVQERDVDTLAEKLAFLIEHPSVRRGMGRAGRAYVGEHYDNKKLNAKLIEIYEDALRKPQKKLPAGEREAGSLA